MCQPDKHALNNENRNLDADRDPLTGAHPMGAVVGGLAVKSGAEEIKATREGAYRSESISGRDYVEKRSSFDDYGFWVNARGRSRTRLRRCSVRDDELLGRQPRCIQPERESHQPVELNVRMKHLATHSVQRPPIALLGAEPFRAPMEFAWHKLGKSDNAKSGDGHPDRGSGKNRAGDQGFHHGLGQTPSSRTRGRRSDAMRNGHTIATALEQSGH